MCVAQQSPIRYAGVFSEWYVVLKCSYFEGMASEKRKVLTGHRSLQHQELLGSSVSKIQFEKWNF